MILAVTIAFFWFILLENEDLRTKQTNLFTEVVLIRTRVLLFIMTAMAYPMMMMSFGLDNLSKRERQSATRPLLAIVLNSIMTVGLLNVDVADFFVDKQSLVIYPFLSLIVLTSAMMIKFSREETMSGKRTRKHYAYVFLIAFGLSFALVRLYLYGFH